MSPPRLPDHLPAGIRARIVAVRRRRAAAAGEPDPYPDEPVPE